MTTSLDQGAARHRLRGKVSVPGSQRNAAPLSEQILGQSSSSLEAHFGRLFGISHKLLNAKTQVTRCIDSGADEAAKEILDRIAKLEVDVNRVAAEAAALAAKNSTLGASASAPSRGVVSEIEPALAPTIDDPSHRAERALAYRDAYLLGMMEKRISRRDSPAPSLTPPFTVDRAFDSAGSLHYVTVRAALDEDMLDRLNQFLKRKRPKPAKMKNEGGNSDDERKARYEDRDSRVSWFNAQQEICWLHERLVELTRRVANVEWPMLKTDHRGEPICDYEDTQYAVYGPNQHFKAWHQDAFADGHDPEDARQVTIVVMVTGRESYTGGELQAKLPGPNGKKVIRPMRMGAGDAVIFPAKRLEHRVSAVKTGIRKTLVFWASDKASCKYHTELQGKRARLDE